MATKAARARQAKRLREKRRSEGRCIRCGKPTAKTSCAACREKQSRSMKRTKAMRRAEGRCIMCGAKVEGFFSKCAKCRTKAKKGVS